MEANASLYKLIHPGHCCSLIDTVGTQCSSSAYVGSGYTRVRGRLLIDDQRNFSLATNRAAGCTPSQGVSPLHRYRRTQLRLLLAELRHGLTQGGYRAIS